jgi:hypothetical protein
MKKMTLISAITLSTALVACGGGNPSSADGKPDSLLPPGFVLSSSSIASSNASGASSSAGGIVVTSLPIYESFSAIDIDNFLTANYKALSTDPTAQFYFPTSGYPVSTIPSGVPRIVLTDWTNNALWFGNARFTIGQTRLEADTTTADPSVATWGELDLSRPYRISFCVKDTDASTSKKMMIFVDNNTSAQANSIHGNPNRIMYENTANLVPGTRFSLDSSVGTSTSFLGFRVESSTDVIIDDLLIEYQDTPYTGAIPACVADTSFVRPVAVASSSVASSTPASESSSSASSVASSTATSSADSSSASSLSGVIVTEDFTSANETNFFSTDYKTIAGDTSLPFYVATSGQTRITFADGALSMTNARFTFGDKGGETAADVQPNGVLDLSKPYRLSFTVTAAAGTGNFQVYVDNNTTSAGKSIHAAIGSTASRLLQTAADSITTFPHEVVIESDVGTATSFFQFRADSSVTNLTIDDLKLEYQ